MADSKRQAWADAAKIFALILVVAGRRILS
jgi:hypothetical protein